MRKLSVLFMAGLLLVAVVGCSSKSKDDVAAGTTEARDDSSGDSSTTTKKGSSTSDDADRGSNGDSDSPFENLGDCVELSGAYLALTLAPATAALGGEEAASELRDQLGDLEAKIPDAIRDDFETVADAYRAYGEALQNAGGNVLDPDVQQQLQAAQSELDKPEVEAASERIQQYFADTCGG